MKEGKEIEKIETEKEKFSPIESIEEYDKESDKIEAFIDRIEAKIQGPFDPFKKGFWKSFNEVATKMTEEELMPRFKPIKPYDSFFENDGLLDEERKREMDKTEDNAFIKEQFITGESRIYHPGLFSVRFLNRHAFYYLRSKKLLAKEDKALFMKATPGWASGFGNIPDGVKDNIVKAVLEHQMKNLKELSSRSNSKEIDSVLNDLYQKYYLFSRKGPREFKMHFDKSNGRLLNISEKDCKKLESEGIDPDAFIEWQQMWTKGKGHCLSSELSDGLSNGAGGIASLNGMMVECEKKLKVVKKEE